MKKLLSLGLSIAIFVGPSTFTSFAEGDSSNEQDNNSLFSSSLIGPMLTSFNQSESLNDQYINSLSSAIFSYMFTIFTENDLSSNEQNSNGSVSLSLSPLVMLKYNENYIKKLYILQHQFEELRNEVNQRLEYRRKLAITYKSKLKVSHFYFLKYFQPELIDIDRGYFIIEDIEDYIDQLKKGENTFSSFEDYETIINEYAKIFESIKDNIDLMQSKDNLSYSDMESDYNLINNNQYKLYKCYGMYMDYFYDTKSIPNKKCNSIFEYEE